MKKKKVGGKHNIIWEILDFSSLLISVLKLILVDISKEGPLISFKSKLNKIFYIKTNFIK